MDGTPVARLRLVRGGATVGEVTERTARIRNARARAAAGYYDRPDVRERVLSAVLRELSSD